MITDIDIERAFLSEIERQFVWIDAFDYISDADRVSVREKHLDLSVESIEFLSLLLRDCGQLEDGIRHTRLRQKKAAKCYAQRITPERVDRFIQNTWKLDKPTAQRIREELRGFVQILFTKKEHSYEGTILARYRRTE